MLTTHLCTCAHIRTTRTLYILCFFFTMFASSVVSRRSESASLIGRRSRPVRPMASHLSALRSSQSEDVDSVARRVDQVVIKCQ